MLELQSKLVRKEMIWFTDLKGPEVGFRSSWIQGCKQHHDWVSPSLRMIWENGIETCIISYMK